MDELEKAREAIDLGNGSGEPWAKAYYQRAIAHALIDIATSLRAMQEPEFVYSGDDALIKNLLGQEKGEDSG